MKTVIHSTQKNENGTRLLKATGTGLMVWSILEIVVEILDVMKYDLASFEAGSIFRDLLLFQAGNAAVPILLSLAGLAAGAAAVYLVDDDRFNSWLRLAGIALIVIYVIEGVMLAGANPGLAAWLRLAIVLVFAVLYLIGAWQLQKEDSRLAHQH